MTGSVCDEGAVGMTAIVIEEGPEDVLAAHLSYAGIAFVRQAQPFLPRKFAVDFLIDAEPPLIVEVDGGIYRRDPSHSSINGILRDMTKQNLATLNGFRLLRFTGQQVRDGDALTMIEQVLEAGRD